MLGYDIWCVDFIMRGNVLETGSVLRFYVVMCNLNFFSAVLVFLGRGSLLASEV